TAAAKVLGVPVSSVSRAVGHLEEELGVRLLHRTTRKLSLSDSGRVFFQRMQAAIAEAEEARRAVTGFATEPRGLVRITAAAGAGGERFARLLARVAARYPKISIDLHVTYRVVDLVSEGFDLAIRAGKLDDSSLVARKVAESELRLFAAPSYLADHGRPRTPADLAGHACLTYGKRAANTTLRLEGPRGKKVVNVRGPFSCDDMGFLREATVAGLGIALLPTELAEPAVRASRLVRVLPRWGIVGGGLYLVWPSQKLVPAHVAAVREMLIEELARSWTRAVE
ncbi:MAG TPA: LysR family transcriptional regulator, partial [Polyangiaceae bacterium]